VTAWRAHALTRGGAAAAFVVGTVTFGAGGLRGALVLLAFFISATALSRLGRARKRAIGEIAKGGPRDARQVAANGGIATLCILAAGHTGWGFAAFAGAYAAANADTWGTELGMLARQPPRSILGGAPVATGISGGVTTLGTLAELAGAALIAGFVPSAALAVGVGGVAGALLDSLLGATVQARRWCSRCARECENDPHACGTPTVPRRGLRWFGNDAVNVAATAAGALIAAALSA
jgi:uncharacterized protein (TIGR00297 family)